MKIISLIIFTLIAVINIYLQDRKHNKIKKYRKMTKALLMPSLLLLYVSISVSVEFYIVFALIFGWFGDLFLMTDKPVDRGGEIVDEIDDKYILLGMLSFLIGHLFYGICFLLKISNFETIPFEIYSLVVVFILFSTFMLNIIRPKEVMKIGAPLYSVVLAFMGYSTLLLMYDNFSASTVMMFIGALIFISSDSILSLSFI